MTASYLDQTVCGSKVRERVSERALGFAESAVRNDERCRLHSLRDIFSQAAQVLFKKNFVLAEHESSIRASSPKGGKQLTLMIISSENRFRLEKQMLTKTGWKSFSIEGFYNIKEELEKYAKQNDSKSE